MGLLLLYTGIAIGVSFLCSLLEAALLSVSTSTLHTLREHGRRGASLLLEIKQTRLDDAISAVLTLNTISNTLGATLAGAQAAHVFGDVWVGVFSGWLTFMILVVSEIIPKTVGAVYAAQLSGFVGHAFHFLTRVMSPVLVLSRALTRVLTRGRRVGVSRGELAAFIASATRDGAISHQESELLANLLRFEEVQVSDVMTPRTVAFMLPARSTIEDLLTNPESEVFSRIPLYRDQPDNVIGYVLQRDVLRAAARGTDRTVTLDRFVRSIGFLPEIVSVGAALRQVLERREPIAMVTDEHGGIDGLVTLEDLTETILGVEIVDEYDRVADLREVAVRMRQDRLRRLQERREQATQPSGQLTSIPSADPPAED